MQITCCHDSNVGDRCGEPATVAIITKADEDDYLHFVSGACDGHAPEVMHELIASGVTTDDMVTVTIDPPLARPQDNLIGKRVEVPAHTDAWMMGDRYGVVTAVAASTGQVSVFLDRSQTTRTFFATELKVTP